MSGLSTFFRPAIAVLRRLGFFGSFVGLTIVVALPFLVALFAHQLRTSGLVGIIVATLVAVYAACAALVLYYQLNSSVTCRLSAIDEVEVGTDLTGSDIQSAFDLIDQRLVELNELRAELDSREAVEEELRLSEARYRHMFIENRTIQLVIDPIDGVIVDANPAACSFYMYPIEALKSMKITDLNTANGDHILRMLVDPQTLEIPDLSFQHRLSNGELRQVEVRPTYIEVHGRPLIHELVIDVTDKSRAIKARQIAEAKYEKIFHNAVEGIFQTTVSGSYLSANPALARMYLYDSTADLLQHVSDIGQQIYVDPSRRAELLAVIESEGIITEAESQVYRKDGSIIWVSETMRAVRDSSGEIAYYEGTVQDITSRRVLEMQRDEMLLDAMERADRDPLTNLLNHRSFHKVLREQAEEAVSDSSTLAVVSMDIDNFKFFNDAYGHVAGDDVLKLMGSILVKACRPCDTVARFGADEFALLLPNLEAEELDRFVQRLSDEISKTGYRVPGYDIAIPLSASTGTAVFPTEAADPLEALELADARMLRTKKGETDEHESDQLRRSMARSLSGFSMLDALVTAVDNKDRYTRRHSEDVLTYSFEIGTALGLDEKDLHDIKVAAMLHDVGKIGVPDYILRKPGRLSDDEFEAIKNDPMMGAVIVAAVAGLEHCLDAIRHHHERWDGEGYPWGLRGEEIPLVARLMAVADAYSAMTTDRPYRKSLPASTALRILEEGAGTQWDPECIKAFLSVRVPRTTTTPAGPKTPTPLTSAFSSKATGSLKHS